MKEYNTFHIGVLGIVVGMASIILSGAFLNNSWIRYLLLLFGGGLFGWFSRYITENKYNQIFIILVMAFASFLLRYLIFKG